MTYSDSIPAGSLSHRFWQVAVGCIGIGAIHHAFSYSRTALTTLRIASVVLLIFAIVFGYGPGAWVWPAAIIALLLTSIASGRQWAHLRRLTNESV